MSRRITVARARSGEVALHVWRDAFDPDGTTYLEVEDDATGAGLVVALPRAVRDGVARIVARDDETAPATEAMTCATCGQIIATGTLLTLYRGRAFHHDCFPRTT